MENQPFRDIVSKNKENIENTVNNPNKQYQLLQEKYKQKMLQNQELEKQVTILYNLLHNKGTKELLQYVHFIKVNLAKIRKTEKIVKAAIRKFEAEKQNFLHYLKKISKDIKSAKNNKIKLIQVIQHYKTQYSELIQYAQTIEQEKSELEERNKVLEKLYLQNNSEDFDKTSLEEVAKVQNSATIKDKSLKQGHKNNNSSIPFGFSYKEPEYMHFSGGPFFSGGDFLNNQDEEDEKNDKIAKLEKKLEETMKQLVEMKKNFNQLREKNKKISVDLPDIGNLNGFEEDQENDSLDISDLEKYVNDYNWE